MVSTIVVISSLVAFPIAAIVAGLVAARRVPHWPWVRMFVFTGVCFSFAATGVLLAAFWIDWVEQDQFQANIVAEGTVMTVIEHSDKSEYEVTLPRGMFARVMRHRFDPPLAQIGQSGGICGLMLATVTSVVFSRSKRRRRYP